GERTGRDRRPRGGMRRGRRHRHLHDGERTLPHKRHDPARRVHRRRRRRQARQERDRAGPDGLRAGGLRRDRPVRGDGRSAQRDRRRAHGPHRCPWRARRARRRYQSRTNRRRTDHAVRFDRHGRSGRCRGDDDLPPRAGFGRRSRDQLRRMTEIPFREALRVWAKVALLSFGGPAGQIAVMHRELVEERQWIDEPQFLHALNFCMLLPGPEAQQLATYIGWLKNGVKGGIAAGGLFILPGVIAIMALSMVYATWGATPLLAGLFFGLKAAVLAIVLDAVIRIGKRALQSPAKKAIAAAAFVAIFFFAVPFPLIVLAAAVGGFLAFANVNADPPGRIPERRRSLWVPA